MKKTYTRTDLPLESRPTCCGQVMSVTSKAGSGNQRYKCSQCGTRTTSTLSEEARMQNNLGYNKENARKRCRALRKTIREQRIKRFVVTSAQNNTPAEKNLLAALKRYCAHNDAQLIILPSHYKNVNAYTASQKEQKTWQPELEEYLIDEAIDLGPVVIRGDIRVQCTTLNPLQGKEPINGKKWTVFGHPQFAMEPVASPMHTLPKRMYTTGSVTQPNYSQSNLGARAEFHHITGAIVIELVGRKSAPFIRHLNCDSTGGFYDLDKYYSPTGIKKGTTILTLTPGDEHVKHMLPSVRKATYDAPDSITKRLKPDYIVRHDVLDGYAGSHHHEKDDVLRFKKFHNDDDNYRAELDEVVDFINETTPSYAQTIIVPSNHHDHLDLWLQRVDPKKDPKNALLIHELKQAQYENSLNGGPTDALQIYLAPRLRCNFRFLDRSELFEVGGVAYDQHGDVGTNGSKGSARGLAKLTYKMVIGHTHGARIVRSVYQVGTSTGPLEYEKGLGDHTNTHCIQYPNGKRTLIDIFKGRWHG